VLSSRPCADDLCEGEYEEPAPLLRDDEPPCTFIVPALAPSHDKSTAGFAGISEPRVPFRGRPPELLARASLEPAPIPKLRTDELFGVIHAKLEELAVEDDPLCPDPPPSNEPPGMAGPSNNPVQVYRTGRANHWEFLRLRTGFELPSSWVNLPGYGSNRNRSGLDFMRWSDFDLGTQDLNDIQRPKYFFKK
jgi:hypothetical protein